MEEEQIVGTPVWFADGMICCPYCRGTNLHHVGVDIWSRESGEDSMSVLRAFGRSAGTPRNPSDRRDAVAISFACEMCPGAKPVLVVVQHKGCTFVEWTGAGLGGVCDGT